ncbi:PspA/IM30 family protein [Paenibacillus turicensis]|uniref:PspA/IM30 family protein n=1 Tax=Paenibacillus turicensis TaxID=160487 RepID=UPI003D2CEE44
MSILQRLSNLTKASIHEVLDKLEDPVMMTGQYLRNHEQEIQKAEASLKQLQIRLQVQERQLADAKNSSEKQELAALAALEAGNEEQARILAASKIAYEEKVQQYTSAIQFTQEGIAELEIHLANAKEELISLKEKRKELAARARKVDEQTAKQTDQPSFSYGIHQGEAARGFYRMEEKIEELEAERQVMGYHHATSYTEPSPAQSLAVNDEIERLKEKLNK